MAIRNTGNNWILYINENVTDQQIEDSKKELAEAKESAQPLIYLQHRTINLISQLLQHTRKQFDTAITTGTQ